MKRDQDLIREILLRVEEGNGRDEVDLSFDGHEEYEVMYHVRLLHKDGYVIGNDFSPTNESSLIYEIRDLTMKGHDFLADARDINVWDKAKKRLQDSGTTVSLAILQALLVSISKEKLGIK